MTLPEGWTVARLGDVCLPVSKWDPRQFPEDEFAYIDIGGIDGQRIVETKRFSGAGAPSRARQIVQSGDTVLSTVRTYLKKTALVPQGLGGATASTGFCVLRPSRAVDSRFLFYRVTADDFVSSLSTHQTGSSYPAVRDRDVLAQQVTLPPLAEQRRIVAAIEEQFSRLDAAERAVGDTRRRLIGLARGVLDSAFSGDTERRSLATLLREPLRNGHSAKASRSGVGVRTLTLTAVTRGEFVDAHTKLADADPSRVIDLWLKPGDILIERSNTPELVGTAALYRGPEGWAIFPDLLIRVRTLDGLLPEYLALFLKSSVARSYFKRRAQGIAGSMPKIDQRAVSELPVPVPSVDEQRDIVAELEQQLSLIDSLRAAVESAQKHSAALRRAILERAFRGELVPQDPDDEPASVLLERIRAERAAPPAAKRRRRAAV